MARRPAAQNVGPSQKNDPLPRTGGGDLLQGYQSPAAIFRTDPEVRPSRGTLPVEGRPPIPDSAHFLPSEPVEQTPQELTPLDGPETVPEIHR
jgi:hypothetical protein